MNTDCAHCGSSDTQGAGSSRGSKRVHCLDCNRTFSPTSKPRGRRPIGERTMTSAERKQRQRFRRKIRKALGPLIGNRRVLVVSTHEVWKKAIVPFLRDEVDYLPGRVEVVAREHQVVLGGVTVDFVARGEYARGQRYDRIVFDGSLETLGASELVASLNEGGVMECFEF